MRKLLIILIILSLVFKFFDFITLVRFVPQNSQLFINGQILTMDDERPSVEAVFVKNGIISAIGGEKELSLIIDEDTEIIDLQNQTLLPGFIDSHTHPIASTFLYNMIDLSGFKHQSKDELWLYLEDEIDKFASNGWILCKGFDPLLIKGLQAPNINYLDSIAPNNPLLIASLNMHDYWVNTKAFEVAGISKNTIDPSESSYYEKDKLGKLSGHIIEQEAFKPFRDSIVEAIGHNILMENSTIVLDEYAMNGNTTITSMGLSTDNPDIVRLYQHLSSEKSTIINRLFSQLGLLPIRKPTVRNFIFVRSDAASKILPESINNGDDFFKIVGVKFWYDGSPYAGSMYINEPYLENSLTNEKLHYSHSHIGSALLNKDELKDKIINYQNLGWQVAIHTQGDKAIEEVLNIFQGINYDLNGYDYRHRLEHCLMLSKSSIEKMSILGVHPSFHINHLYYYGDILAEKIIGLDRTEKMLPVDSAESESLIVSLHADQPMFESDPISLLHTAVNRTTNKGKLIGEENSISVMSGLKALTINAAWQIKMEEKIGSIKIGKYADFVVLDKNPLTIPKSELRKINVMATIVNGNTIFKKDLN